MIYVLCLNPAIDCYEEYSNLKIGQINNTDKQELVPAGKGINLSIMFKNLGIETKLITVLGGFTGKYIYDTLNSYEINVLPIWTEQVTRINFKITGTEETAFNISSRESKDVIIKVKNIINKLTTNDILVVSGSGYGYREILQDFKGRLILDVNGKELKNLVDYYPYLVKPNLDELIEFSDNDNIEESLLYLKKYTKKLLCTFGDKGSILMSDNLTLRQGAVEDKLKTTVGCGDTFLATYLGFIELGYEEEQAFNYARIGAYLKGKYNKFPTKEEIIKNNSL